MPVPSRVSAIPSSRRCQDLARWIRRANNHRSLGLGVIDRLNSSISKPKRAICRQAIIYRISSEILTQASMQESSGRQQNVIAPIYNREKCGRHRLLEPHVTTTFVIARSRCEYCFAILSRNAGIPDATCIRYARHGPRGQFITEELRSRQIRFAQAEIDTIRQCPFEKWRISVGCRP